MKRKNINSKKQENYPKCLCGFTIVRGRCVRCLSKQTQIIDVKHNIKEYVHNAFMKANKTNREKIV